MLKYKFIIVFVSCCAATSSADLNGLTTPYNLKNISISENNPNSDEEQLEFSPGNKVPLPSLKSNKQNSEQNKEQNKEQDSISKKDNQSPSTPPNSKTDSKSSASFPVAIAITKVVKKNQKLLNYQIKITQLSKKTQKLSLSQNKNSTSSNKKSTDATGDTDTNKNAASKNKENNKEKTKEKEDSSLPDLYDFENIYDGRFNVLTEEDHLNFFKIEERKDIYALLVSAGVQGSVIAQEAISEEKKVYLERDFLIKTTYNEKLKNYTTEFKFDLTNTDSEASKKGVLGSSSSHNALPGGNLLLTSDPIDTDDSLSGVIPTENHKVQKSPGRSAISVQRPVGVVETLETKISHQLNQPVDLRLGDYLINFTIKK